MEECTDKNNVNIAVNSSSLNFKANFDRQLYEYDGKHQGAHRKPWTSERIFEVINDIKKARAVMSCGQRRKAMDYYWMSKYDIMTTENEDCLIFKRVTDTAPPIRILPREQYFDVLSDVHESCGHGGRDKILYEIRNRYYIPKKAVEIYLSLCPVCESKRNVTRKSFVTKSSTLCLESSYIKHNSGLRPQNESSEEPPPADTVCRVCLVKHSKLFPVTNDLQNVYETVTREEYNKVGYPVCMCHICLAELRKCYMFVETARDSNRVLELWYGQHKRKENKEAKPQETYTVIKESTISIEIEDVSLQHIKEEVMDLDEMDRETECHVECDIGMYIKKEDIDEQTDIKCEPTDSTYNAALQDNNDRQQEAKCPSVDQGPGTSGELQLDDVKTETKPTIDKIEIEINTRSMDSTKHCTLCYFKCVTDSDLLRHMRFHDSSRPRVCDVCQYRFEDFIQLKKHKLMHVTVKTFKDRYFCDRCDFKCVKKRDFRNHKKIHIGEKRFSCDVCDYKCVNRGRLNEHKKTHTGVKPHSCHICSFKTTAAYILANHLKIHTGEKPFTCNICDHKVRTKARLTEHMKRHTGEIFTCDICDFKSTSKSQLKKHILIHTGEKPFLCEICSHTFTGKASLQNHVKSKHTDEKPFSCNVCNYKTSRKGYLRYHVRKHTGEKPFSCNMCDFKCSHRLSLKHHLLTKHKIKKEDTTKMGHLIKVGTTKTGSS